MLRGADLVFACIAFLEGLPLVTRDTAFDRYAIDVEVINPERLMSGWRAMSPLR